ncbi:lytic polysaccharide monooxygenase [Nonomuraea turcica]|uniref:lytic polysaccharide monooxygenase n=1 Tax=Nonomuraea sp. G32 TaxID=3067274 RepID=UPI00273BEB69|nr:lytic polysaccharide monooxygenase [Nonomuraea sp. G32]MDP4502062.1 lytic polysaccharide monooxygenase [Nonomuraea sp. G32]
MQQRDPMCWQAWQDNTNAMWNWNGLYRDNVGGNHQAVIPNGQLCSAGQTQGGRYRSMDTPGAWTMANLPSTFDIGLTDQARHGADYISVYRGAGQCSRLQAGGEGPCGKASKGLSVP